MGRIICITGTFQKYDYNGQEIPGETEFGVSHGIDEDTGQSVVLPFERPQTLGAKYDNIIGEWVLE